MTIKRIKKISTLNRKLIVAVKKFEFFEHENV